MYWLQKKLILRVLLSTFIANSALSSELSGLLDGKSFIGHNGAQGHVLDHNEVEEIIFQNGLFWSVSCEPYNFNSSKYLTTVIGDTIYFEALTESPSHGQIRWLGLVKNGSAEITFTWTKKHWYWDIRREYWFKGTLQE